MQRALIFDLDQTLLESPGMLDAFLHAASFHDVDLDTALPIWHSSRGWSLYDLASHLLDAQADDPRVHDMSDRFWQHMSHVQATPLDGAQQLLDQLHDDPRVKLYLSTGSHPVAAKRWLESLDWLGYFQLVLGSIPGSLKGADHYRQIMDHSGFDVDVFGPQSASIGDGEYDMRYAVQHDVQLRIGYVGGITATEQQLRDCGATHTITHLDQAYDLLTSGL